MRLFGIKLLVGSMKWKKGGSILGKVERVLQWGCGRRLERKVDGEKSFKVYSRKKGKT